MPHTTQRAIRKKSSSGYKAAAQMTDWKEGMRTGAVAGGLNFSGTVRRLSGVEGKPLLA
jgi:hypothetical protein